MESIAVTKPDMTVTRQEPLSPFGLLTALFTQELVRRNGQAAGMYRPLRLAYLEEDENEAQPAPPEIHFDLDVDLIVNRLMKQTQAKEKTENKSPAQRILERVVVREKEIRTAYPETRRIVIENAGRRTEVSLPVKRTAQEETAAQSGREMARRIEAGPRQAGEGRSTQKTDVPRRSAGLTQLSRPVGAAAPTPQGTLAGRTLTLASQAMSVPSAGGWTPKQREIHPGYPSQEGSAKSAGIPSGSILLPDVMRRRREAALERRGTPEIGTESLETALMWAAEGTEQTPETERVLHEVRRAVRETLRRNEQRGETEQKAQAAQMAGGTLQMAQVSRTDRLASLGVQGTQATAPAEENEARFSAAVPRSSAIPESGRGADTEKAGVTAQEAGRPSAEGVRQAAIPAREERVTDEPAELTFHEAREKTAAEQTEATARTDREERHPYPAARQTREKTGERRASEETGAAPAAPDPTGGAVTRKTDRAPQAEETGATAHETNGPAAPGEWNQAHTKAADTLSGNAEAAEGALQAAIPAAEAAAAAPAQMVFRGENAETAAQDAQRPGVPPQTQREAWQAHPAAQPARERAGERNTAAEIKKPRGAEIYGPGPSVTGPGTAGEPAQTAQEIPETGRPARAGTQSAGIREAIPRESEAAGTAPQAAIPAQEAPAAAPAQMVFRGETAEAAAQDAQRPGIPPQTQREAWQTHPAAQPARERAGERNAAAEIKEPRGAEIYGPGPSVTGPGTAGEPSQTAQEIPETGRPARAGTQSAGSAEAIPAQEGPQNVAAPAELVFRGEAGETAAQTAPQAAFPAQPRQEARQTSPEERSARERAYERRAAAGNGEPGTTKDGTGEAAAQLAVPAQPEALSGAPAQMVFRGETAETAAQDAQRPGVPPQTQREAWQTQPAAQPARESAGERNAAAEIKEPRAVRQTLRDIRVAAAHDAESLWYAGKTERVAEAVPAPEPAQMPGQTELFFAETPKTDVRAAEDAAAKQTEKPAREEKTERMPAWAKELLEQSGVTDSVQQADVFRSAESAARSGRQITWSAPAMPNPVMNANEDRSGPADLMFREHREAAETPYKPQISDAELQRTADRVYRMIEERLRRELRRSGR